MTSHEPHSGWAAASARLAPAVAALEGRLAQARLKVGLAAPALSLEQFVACMGQQKTMIEEAGRQLTVAVAAISGAVNADAAPGSDDAELNRCCDDLARCLTAIADWADAVWLTTPPPEHARSFAAVREIPGEILTQMRKYFDTIAKAGRGEITESQNVEIDIQPLIDRFANAGMMELRAYDAPTQTKDARWYGGCLLVIVVVLLLAYCSV